MDLDQSVVHRKLDSKLKIVGLEIHDLLFVLLFAAFMNLFFGQSFLSLYLVFIMPLVFAGTLYVVKRNKPDGFLLHYLRYFIKPGFLSAGDKEKFYNSKKVRINETKLKR